MFATMSAGGEDREKEKGREDMNNVSHKMSQQPIGQSY
jgi:hypothetical protein